MGELLSDGSTVLANGTKILPAVPLPSPWAPSYSYVCSVKDWTKIRDIMGGADAMRAKREAYLPKYALESDKDYKLRVERAPFENHFVDALDSLCDKPFAKEVQSINTPAALEPLIEDLDGEGTSLHLYASDAFKEGVAGGRAGIFVDYPVLDENATLADAQRQAARPYWILLQAEDVLVCERKRVGSKSVITKLLFWERRDEVVASTSVMLRTLRIYEHDGTGDVTFEIVKEVSAGNWTSESKGTLRGMSHIPYADFVTGRRDRLTGRIIPPLMPLADLQIEHYEQGANLKHVLRKAAFPMLCGNGVTPPPPDPKTGEPEPLHTGPDSVLYAPPIPGASQTPQWEYLEPAGTSIDKLLENMGRIEATIDKLGKAPLIRSTGNVTATSDAIGAAKGHATAEAWAGRLRETLELALYYTMEWMSAAQEVSVQIDTEFGIEENQADSAEIRNNYSEGIISLETTWEELQRRGSLSTSFDPKQEKIRLKQEKAEKQADMMEQMKLGLIANPNANVMPFGSGKGGKGGKGKGNGAGAPPQKQAA